MNNLQWFWLLGSASLALLDWAATWFGNFRLMYFTKPATLFLLFLWAFSVSHWQGKMLYFGVGLVFCLAGDIVLMLRSRFFLMGLGAFLVGQIWYMAGLHQTALPQQPLAYIGGGIILAAAFFPVFEIARTIRRRRGPKPLITAIVLYGLVEGMLLVSASLTLYKPQWLINHAILMTLGAALFVLSDILLGFDRYVHPIQHGRTWVHISYHLAQVSIVVAAVLHVIKS